MTFRGREIPVRVLVWILSSIGLYGTYLQRAVVRILRTLIYSVQLKSVVGKANIV